MGVDCFKNGFTLKEKGGFKWSIGLTVILENVMGVATLLQIVKAMLN